MICADMINIPSRHPEPTDPKKVGILFNQIIRNSQLKSEMHFHCAY